jgi:hypothetical protein
VSGAGHAIGGDAIGGIASSVGGGTADGGEAAGGQARVAGGGRAEAGDSFGGDATSVGRPIAPPEYLPIDLAGSGAIENVTLIPTSQEVDDDGAVTTVGAVDLDGDGKAEGSYNLRVYSGDEGVVSEAVLDIGDEFGQLMTISVRSVDADRDGFFEHVEQNTSDPSQEGLFRSVTTYNPVDHSVVSVDQGWFDEDENGQYRRRP